MVPTPVVRIVATAPEAKARAVQPSHGVSTGLPLPNRVVKSVATHVVLAELGATIVDADALVHEMQAAGQPMLDEIRTAFGDGVIREDGSLDRPALGAIVFRDPPQRKTLDTPHWNGGFT